MHFRHAALVARLSGYCHDFGKASNLFQKKLKNSTNNEISKIADPVRHEWLSAWLMNYLVASGQPLNLQQFQEAWKKMGISPKGNPLPIPSCIESWIDATLWVIGTHHGPVGGSIGDSGITNGNHVRESNGAEDSTWQNFALAETLDDIDDWESLFDEIRKTVDRLAKINRSALYWEGVMLAARTALILADHKISSETYPFGPVTKADRILFANTKKIAESATRLRIKNKRNSVKKRFLDQPLAWHMKTIGNQAADNLRILAGEGLPVVDGELVQKIIEDRSSANNRFIWQNKAVEAVSKLTGGGLVFNVASTGAGKTLANLKMAAAMRPDNLRLAVAFNLRSLTTQTHAAFGSHLKRIDKELFERFFQRDFACLIGERYFDMPEFALEDCDGIDDGMDAGEDIIGAEKLKVPDWLKTHIAKDGKQEKLEKLIASPVLISTMDWISASGEPGEQARHAKALIRVINSDLILDEVDSYDVKATVAIMRVVRTAASFGRNVIISSATLNPEIAKGLVIAYSSGRNIFEAMTGENDWSLVMVSDLFEPVKKFAPSAEGATEAYRNTMSQMAHNLKNRKPTKKFRVADVTSAEWFGNAVAEQAAILHNDMAYQPDGLNCRLSIGLVRVANVKPCMEVSEYLMKDDRFVVTVYHAREADKRRAWKEAWLDRVLDRTDGSKWVDALKEVYPDIKNRTGDVRLIVVATPVEEVGRDHDFDWAIIEPSSIHSIIQTAGRVNRHRLTPLEGEQVNVAILSKNLLGLEGKRFCFISPGLECERAAGQSDTTHKSHDMKDLLNFNEFNPVLDASLIFGSRKTLFAQYDEDAVALTIKDAMDVINRSPGHQMDFMKHDYIKKFPLRDKDRRLFYWRDNDKIYLETGRNNKDSSGNFTDEYKDIGRATCWLSPPNYEKDSFTVKFNGLLPSKVTGCWNGLKIEF